MNEAPDKKKSGMVFSSCGSPNGTWNPPLLVADGKQVKFLFY
jgi:hypothetical protein